MGGGRGGKRFTVGKYEGTRIRAAIAELIANGGAPMGFYTRYTDPNARKVITQYYNFIRRHDRIYRYNQPAAESVLLFPRQAVHAGKVAEVQKFLKLGDELLDQHVLFDILPDDLATEAALGEYKTVYRVDKSKPAASARFKITAPKTTRASLSRPAKGDALHLHFVNYNRTEPKNARSAGGGIHDENPISVKGIHCSMALPEGKKIKNIKFFTPEKSIAMDLIIVTKENRIEFTLPEFLVYGVVEISF